MNPANPANPANPVNQEASKGESRLGQVLLSYEGKSPQVHESVYLAPGVCLSGDIQIREDASFWFHAVARGDVNSIFVGAGSNIQDHSILHVSGGQSPTVIGDQVTIGHRVIVHSCRIDDLCIIGMGSILLDNAHIPRHSFVAAGSVVPPGKTYPPGHMIMGSPARAVRLLRPEEIEGIFKSAETYKKLARTYSSNSSWRSGHLMPTMSC
ncbi:MAG: gamma carbonic anhydrase family protein [Oligoflexales bacterium]|nr:gamma carbonic anhydrase family protein [Oligoflexales bacterium]